MKTYLFTIQTQRYTSLVFLLACVAFSTIFISGCTTVRVPTSDSTPPTVNLSLLGEHVMVTSNGTREVVPIDVNRRYSLLVTGSDTDGGVQRAWIEGTVHCGCTWRGESGDTGLIRYPSYGPADHNSDGAMVEASPGDSVKIKLVDALDFPESAIGVCSDCRPGMEDFHISGEYTGHAENFSGVSATTAPLILESR